MSVLINLTNHPSEKWGTTQTEAAHKIGKTIIDFPFPNVDPHLTNGQIISLATKTFTDVCKVIPRDEADVSFHVMGESNLTFELVKLIKMYHYKCYASTTERIVEEMEDGSKIAKFNFIQFRKY